MEINNIPTIKLLHSSEFIIALWDKDITREEFAQRAIKNASFMNQEYKIEHFVPIDKYGVVLEDLKYCCTGSDCGCMGMPVNVCSHKDIDNYYKAEEKVLFKNVIIKKKQNSDNPNEIWISIKGKGIMVYNKDKSSFVNQPNGKIQDLVKLNLELTKTGLKNAGYE